MVRNAFWQQERGCIGEIAAAFQIEEVTPLANEVVRVPRSTSKYGFAVARPGSGAYRYQKRYD